MLEPSATQAERRRLFDAYRSCSTAGQFAAFQRILADAIIESEIAVAEAKARGSRDDVDEFRYHQRRLRSLGDSMAWDHLHSHSIRQLAKQGARPASLKDQLEGISTAIKTVEAIAETETVAIACDLTNCLRLGDIVVVDDPEAPTIIEFKRRVPQDGELLLGRKGRQLGRLLATSKYLETGEAVVPGEPLPRVCIEVDDESEPHWDAVRTVLEQFNRGGEGVVTAEAGQVFYASSDGKPLDELKEHVERFERPVMGAHIVFSDGDRPDMPPPPSWPVTQEDQWALLEGEVVFVSLVDEAEFVRHAAALGRTLRIEDEHFFVETKLGELQLSSRFMSECVYNFHGVARIVATMLELADRAAAMADEFKAARTSGEGTNAPPEGGEREPRVARVFAVKDHNDARRLAEEGVEDINSVVLMDMDLWSDLSGRKGRPRLLIWPSGDSDEGCRMA